MADPAGLEKLQADLRSLKQNKAGDDPFWARAQADPRAALDAVGVSIPSGVHVVVGQPQSGAEIAVKSSEEFQDELNEEQLAGVTGGLTIIIKIF